jgi:hypothetical protein
MGAVARRIRSTAAPAARNSYITVRTGMPAARDSAVTVGARAPAVRHSHIAVDAVATAGCDHSTFEWISSAGPFETGVDFVAPSRGLHVPRIDPTLAWRGFSSSPAA